MPNIPCPCGGEVQVEYWHAGSEQECPKCHADVSVPSLDVLKRMDGDLHPDLSDWQKLVVAIGNSEPPFHGPCLGCGDSTCQFIVPVRLAVLEERHLDEDSPVGITPIGVEVQVSGGTEIWKAVQIPLRFCPGCYRSFNASYWRGAVLRSALIFGVITVSLAAFLLALPCGFIGVGVTLFVLYRAFSHWKNDIRFHAWLDRLPPVKRIIDRESEYRLRKLQTQNL
jgi:hypothetical protein